VLQECYKSVTRVLKSGSTSVEEGRWPARGVMVMVLHVMVIVVQVTVMELQVPVMVFK
jgi:hypothetical protein